MEKLQIRIGLLQQDDRVEKQLLFGIIDIHAAFMAFCDPADAFRQIRGL
ncbi:MAG: hypothetical protein KH128_10705 [Firmicutes bacterium]|nr:hypothetical protein [Bacillota bacterium]